MITLQKVVRLVNGSTLCSSYPCFSGLKGLFSPFGKLTLKFLYRMRAGSKHEIRRSRIWGILFQRCQKSRKKGIIAIYRKQCTNRSRACLSVHFISIQKQSTPLNDRPTKILPDALQGTLDWKFHLQSDNLPKYGMHNI